MRVLLIIPILVIYSKSESVTEYLGACNETTDCEWLGPNSICQYYVCKCKEGYRWYQGGCKPYGGLGHRCEQNLDCYDGYNPLSLTCSDETKTCLCSPNYYARDNIDCRKIAAKENDLCALNIDCKSPNTICVLGKCKNPARMSSSCHTAHEDQEMKSEVNRSKAISCIDDEGCKDLANSECYKPGGFCVCKRGFFQMGDKCVGEIGVNINCASDADCLIKPSVCNKITGQCFCRDYYFTQDGNRKCIKTMSEVNWNCLSNEWCFALGPFSYCSSNETCECSRVAKLNGSLLVCDKFQEDPDICVTDLECQDKLLHGICKNEVCQCKDHFREDEGKCMPNIGAPCDNGEFSCTLANSTCTEGLCKCNTGYVNEDDMNCYPIIGKLGDECHVDVQCSSAFANSGCVNQTCQCIGNFFEGNGICYEKKDYLSYCTSRLECTVPLGPTFVCRNNLCQCETGDHYVGDVCQSNASIKEISLYVIAVFFLTLIMI